MVGGAEDELAAFRQAAGRCLQDEGLQIATPQARIDHVRARAHQRRDFGAVLACAELRQQVGNQLGVGIKLSGCGDEVGPAVLPPGVVLVDRRKRVHLDVLGLHVPDQADIIHRGMRGGAEHVIVFAFLEDARRAAIHQHQHLLQLFSDRRHREAVAGADIAEHDIDIVALVEIAQFLHLLGGAAVLVDDDRARSSCRRTRPFRKARAPRPCSTGR